MGELVGGDFDWGRTEKTYETSAAYDISAKRGNYFSDFNDPETYDEAKLVITDLPDTELQTREEQIVELLPEVFPESDLIHITEFGLSRTKRKVIRKVIERASEEDDNVIPLSNGATAILIEDTNQKVS